jgi:integrase
MLWKPILIPSDREADAFVRQQKKHAPLKFHDLRREFGSQLLKTPGVTVHHVRDALGHADLNTTSRYLSMTLDALEAAMRRREARRAGFAQDSHTPTNDAPADTTASHVENPANTLH